MEYVLAGIVGVSLAAACGLRAFVPVLGLALASKAGWVNLGPSFGWLGSWPAIAALCLATATEVTASSIPVVAHLLDALAAPVACAAGAIVMASQVGPAAGLPSVSDVDPMLWWGSSLIAGGGVAGAVHAASASVRAASSSVSAGLLAPVYGLAESIASVVTSVLAVLVPVVLVGAAGLGLIVVAWLGIAWLRRRGQRTVIPAIASA